MAIPKATKPNPFSTPAGKAPPAGPPAKAGKFPPSSKAKVDPKAGKFPFK